MSTTYHTRLPAALLIGLPLLSNAASFIVFAPLFVPGRTPSDTNFRLASMRAAIAILVVELLALWLIVRALRREHASLKSVVNVQPDRVRAYLFAGGDALLPTLAAGWLYARAQALAGVETSLSRLSWAEIGWRYVAAPVSAAFLEETIWRGYALPRLRGAWRGLLLTSLSFALFHGIFNPLAVVATCIQGLAWGWTYRRTNSTAPGMALHVLSRYLALVPGFG